MSFQSCINESYNATFNNLTVNGQLALSSGSISNLTISDALNCPVIESSSSSLSIVPNTTISGTLQVDSATNLTNTNINGTCNISNLTISDALNCPVIESSSSSLSIVPNTIVSGTLQVNNETNLTNTSINGTCNITNTLTSTNINNSTNLTTSTLNCSQMFNSLNNPIFPVYAYASNYNNVNLEVNCSVNFIANTTSSSYTVSCSGCVGILVANSSAYTCYVGLESVSGSTYTWIINCSGGGSSPNAQNAYISLMII